MSQTRRGFLGMLAAVCVAPLGVLKAPYRRTWFYTGRFSAGWLTTGAADITANLSRIDEQLEALSGYRLNTIILSEHSIEVLTEAGLLPDKSLRVFSKESLRQLTQEV